MKTQNLNIKNIMKEKSEVYVIKETRHSSSSYNRQKYESYIKFDGDKSEIYKCVNTGKLPYFKRVDFICDATTLSSYQDCVYIVNLLPDIVDMPYVYDKVYYSIEKYFVSE